MNWQELSDRKLVELCLEYNEDAVAELVERYKRMIARTAAKTLSAANLSGLRPTIPLLADLSQDTWARIMADDMRALRDLEWVHEGALRGLLPISANPAHPGHPP